MAPREQPPVVVTLRTFWGTSAVVGLGDPIWLTASIANHRAIGHARRRDELQRRVERAGHELAAGRLTAREFDALVGETREALSALDTRAFTIGTERAPWPQCVTFSTLVAGTWTPLSWPIRPILARLPASLLTVDEAHSYLVEFHLQPGDAGRLPIGRHEVRLELLGQREGDTPARVLSDSVVVVVTGTESSETEDRLLMLASYFGTSGDTAAERDCAQRALERHPDSVGAMYLLGAVEEKAANDEEALSLYRSAASAFERQAVDEYEWPEVLARKIVELEYKISTR